VEFSNFSNHPLNLFQQSPGSSGGLLYGHSELDHHASVGYTIFTSDSPNTAKIRFSLHFTEKKGQKKGNPPICNSIQK